ncbi:MAG: hypothetical protein U5K54_07350 [Cytophagales bacterium]|nr:hypothetical protein [Cytophagales bacterium]
MRTLFLLLFCAVALTTQAQEAQKMGYADWQYIFSQLPETKQIENELKTLRNAIRKSIKG